MPLRPYAALPIIWALVILALTLLPAADMPVTPKWELLAFDTAAHAGVFGLLALLSWVSLRRQRRWPRLARHPGWPLLLGCFLFGGLIEVLQTSMHMGRQGDVKDLIGDTIGAALALGLAWLVRHRIPGGYAVALLTLLLGSGYKSAAQDMARARQNIEKLASPEMHGRGYVQQGEHMAAAYLRTWLKELKLEPLAPNYTQPFALDVNTFPGAITAAVHNAQRNQPTTSKLEVGRDFIMEASSGGQPKQKLRFFPLDSTCFKAAADTAANPNEARPKSVISLKGKCLLITQRQKAKIPGLPQSARTWLASASATATVVPKLTASLSAVQDERPQLEIVASSPVLKGIVPGTTAELTLGVEAQLLRSYQTQNLAAVIRGTVQPDSFLVVSAHYDHLGMMGKDVYFPGANDNASGVAMLLELAAHYAKPENRPAYSVVFLLFGAEEAGLVGSSYFVAHPLVPLKSIKFLINLDLLGTGEQGATVVNGRVFEPAYRRLTALNDAHHYLPALGARGRAANSDHFPFSEAGVPAFFLYTRGGSAAYHDVNDQPAALSLAGFPGAFNLVRDFLNELGASPK
jgi:aminopeptidase YwaD